MEGRGAIDSAHRVKQICGQVFRYAVASGFAERDVTTDLKGALAAPERGHYAAITDPKRVATLLRSIDGYSGHPFALAALKLSPLVFVRPGELRSAELAEIDLDEAEWRIPGHKMKWTTIISYRCRVRHWRFYEWCSHCQATESLFSQAFARPIVA